MMKSAIITSKGIESVAKLEVKEILGLDSEIYDPIVVFEPKTLKDICRLCYFRPCRCEFGNSLCGRKS